MRFVWRDYDPQTMQYIEGLLDESAAASTGLDEGFRDFYAYWKGESCNLPDNPFQCKVVFCNDEPVAVIALWLHDREATIMEVIVHPQMRGAGVGTQLLKELLHCEEIIGRPIDAYEAVIYPDNIASQKAFEHAGFIYTSTHEDQDGISMKYTYRKSDSK